MIWYPAFGDRQPVPRGFQAGRRTWAVVPTPIPCSWVSGSCHHQACARRRVRIVRAWRRIAWLMPGVQGWTKTKQPRT